MTEKEWTAIMSDHLREALDDTPYWECQIEVGRRIPYGFEILSYDDDNDPEPKVTMYETDLVIMDCNEDQSWKPRVIVEAKMKRVHTHDAITYSQKAVSHKTVHPYLRYGIMLGDRQQRPLPGRLYRHGAHFDFMISFVSDRPSDAEIDRFVKIIGFEIDASRMLEKIIYESRQGDRDRYTMLHKRLFLE